MLGYGNLSTFSAGTQLRSPDRFSSKGLAHTPQARSASAVPLNPPRLQSAAPSNRRRSARTAGWRAGPAPPQAGGQGATLGAEAARVASSLAPSVDTMVCKPAVLPTLPPAELLVGTVARRGAPRAPSNCKHAWQAIPWSSCRQSLGAATSAGGPHIFLQVGAAWSSCADLWPPWSSN